MKAIFSLLALSLVSAALIQMALVPAKTVRAAPADGPGFHRQVVNGRVVRIQPLVEPAPQPGALKTMSAEDSSRREFDQTRPGVLRTRDDASREAERGSGQVRSMPEVERRRVDEDRKRPGLRLIFRPAPEQGPPQVEPNQ